MSTNLEGSFKIDHWELEPSDIQEKKFTMTLTYDKNIYRKTEELYSKLQSYFSCSKDQLTRCSLYFSYISQVPELLSSCFVSDQCMTDAEQNRCREIKQENLQAAQLCLKILLIYLESPQTADVSKSIIHTSFTALHQAYTHCRDSETFYGELFEEFTNELGSFYKHIQEVQKATLTGLEKLINADSYDKEACTSEIVLISNDVGKLSELVTSLDRMISIVLWKVFIRLVLKYKDILQKELKVDAFIVPLISDIKDEVIRCRYNIEMEEQVNESDVKVCIVELSMLNKIVEVFKGCWKESIIFQIRDLALHLYNLLIQSHSCTVKKGKDLNIIKILLRTVRHVIVHFFSDSLFFASSFRCTVEEISSDLQIPLVLLKLTAVDYLTSNLEHVQLLQSGEVLTELFSTIKANKPEDDLKLVSVKIPASFISEIAKESTDLATLYQHCYNSLTECCKHICSLNTDSMLEKTWLDIFKSCSNVVYLLISDVWIYYIRCGSIDFVFKSCTTLSEAVVPRISNSRTRQLLIRMLKFLPADYKVRLFEGDIHANHLLFNQKVVHRFGSQPVNPLSMDQVSYEKINTIGNDLSDPISDDVWKLTQKACSILELGALSVDKLLPAELLRLINFATALFKSDVYDIQIAVITFLRSLKERTLSKSDKELDVLTSAIAELLSEMMKSKNYIIRFEAFGVYFSLAQSTPHSEMIKKTVIKCPSLVPSIKSFAEKVPSCGFLNEENRHALLQKQLSKYQSSKTVLQLVSEEKKLLLSSLLQ